MVKKLSEYKEIATLCGLALVFVLGGLVWFGIRAYGVTSPLILHFNDMAGVTQIGKFGTVLGVGFLAAAVALLNTAIAMELATRDRFLGLVAASLNLTLAILLFIAGAAIIGVN